MEDAQRFASLHRAGLIIIETILEVIPEEDGIGESYVYLGCNRIFRTTDEWRMVRDSLVKAEALFIKSSFVMRGKNYDKVLSGIKMSIEKFSKIIDVPDSSVTIQG